MHDAQLLLEFFSKLKEQPDTSKNTQEALPDKEADKLMKALDAAERIKKDVEKTLNRPPDKTEGPSNFRRLMAADLLRKELDPENNWHFTDEELLSFLYPPVNPPVDNPDAYEELKERLETTEDSAAVEEFRKWELEFINTDYYKNPGQSCPLPDPETLSWLQFALYLDDRKQLLKVRDFQLLGTNSNLYKFLLGKLADKYSRSGSGA